jgi:hypothetical protein
MPAGHNARRPHQGPHARACLASFELSRSAFLVWLLLVPAVPLHAANSFTTNDSDGEGVSGVLFAAPPGSCTSFPGTSGGNCETRGAAALADWADGFYNGVDGATCARPPSRRSDLDDHRPVHADDQHQHREKLDPRFVQPPVVWELWGDVEPFDLTGDGQRIASSPTSLRGVTSPIATGDWSLVVGNVSPPVSHG